jgi:hypothetical protein
MLMIGTTSTQLKNRHFNELYNGMKYWRGDFINTPTDLSFSPQSYLVEQLPTITNPTHFHVQNQFQVFTQGSGNIGKHEIKPYVVHYAGAFTGYGPLVSGAEGLHYITLRSQRDPGAKFIPEKTSELIKGPKHHHTTQSLDLLSLEQLVLLIRPERVDIHTDARTGLGISQIRMPKNSQFTVDFLNLSTSAYLLVVTGSIAHQAYHLTCHENIFITKDNSPYTLHTEDLPCELLFLQFPPLSAEYAPSSID